MHNRLFKRLAALVLAMCMVVSMALTAVADTPSTVVTAAEGYVVYDATDGTALLGKNQDTGFYPASITKIMTALLVCENLNLDDQITFTSGALSELTSDSSTLTPVGQVGETMTVKDALYGMYMVSANECAMQLGVAVAGSTAAFAELMNTRASQIGCTNTHFTNAHGLHNADHYTTPHDMALIMAEALKNKAFFEMATTYSYTIPATNVSAARELVSGHNILNGNIYYPEAFAGKTGHTNEAGRTLVTAAKFGTHTVIVVVMKSTDDEYYNDTLRLLEYARGYYDGLYNDMTWTPMDDTVYVVGTNSLSVRDYPSAVGTTIVSHLLYGTGVKRTATWGEWSQVTVNGESLYVYNDYLSTTEPPSEFDPESAVKTTTRANVIVSYDTDDTPTVSPTSEAQSATENVQTETTAVSSSAADSTASTAASINIDDWIAGDDETAATEQKGVTEGNFQSGIIMVIMIIAIILMIVVAALYIWVRVAEKKRLEAKKAALAEKRRKEKAEEERRKKFRKDFSNTSEKNK